MIALGKYKITQAHIDANPDPYLDKNAVVDCLKELIGDTSSILVWPFGEYIAVDRDKIMTTTTFEDWFIEHIDGKPIQPCYLVIFKQEDDFDDEGNPDERLWVTINQLPQGLENEEFC